MSEIIKYDLEFPVIVRKYQVNTDELKLLLKKHKQISKLTIKNISEKLNKPKTEVEHWFRSDNCFSIPDPKIWFELKELLSITTTKFDESITTFVEKPNVFEKAGRFYLADGIAPTLCVC